MTAARRVFAGGEDEDGHGAGVREERDSINEGTRNWRRRRGRAALA